SHGAVQALFFLDQMRILSRLTRAKVLGVVGGEWWRACGSRGKWWSGAEIGESGAVSLARNKGE
nr:hypothetical protein [Tanacetum cinerariifolium]